MCCFSNLSGVKTHKIAVVFKHGIRDNHRGMKPGTEEFSEFDGIQLVGLHLFVVCRYKRGRNNYSINSRLGWLESF